MTRPHPPVRPHGEFEEVLPDVFMITGSMNIGPTRFSRNMTVVREGERLVILNSVRLDDAGLAALDALGKVTDVVRLAMGHGSDDPFYKERYGATVWAVKGQTYFSGFDPKKGDIYFEPDKLMEPGGELPFEGASIYVMGPNPPESVLRLPREGGTLIAGDCLQNWGKADRYFNFAGKAFMTLAGFLKPHNLGPGWIKASNPPRGEVGGLLELDFEHLLPAHGAAVIGGARDKFRPAIERYAGG